MSFQTAEEAINWYESEERVLTPDFLATIPWNDVHNHPLPAEFVPVLLYMRDVETFTTMYFDELKRTPTGKDPIIRRFMERWESEETLHGELLNRFVNETGFATPANWKKTAFANLPRGYKVKARLQTAITNLTGKHFTAVHMTWGAIQELSTLSGYERLWHLGKHPVLEYILRGIVREEARHALFYWSLAKIRLAESPIRQQLARFLVSTFWTPVGQGAKLPEDTNVVIKAVFRDEEGLKLMDQRVTKRIQQLPGFQGFTKFTDRIGQIIHSEVPSPLCKTT